MATSTQGVEIANAWVTVKPSLKGFQTEIRKALGDMDTEASKQGSKSGKSFFDSFNGAIKGIGFGAVAGGAAALTSSVIGSFDQLISSAASASDATDKFKKTLDFAGLDTGTIKDVTGKVQEYADKTVYEIADIQNMTAQLASNGVNDYEALAEAAGNLNAIAGGNAETFKSVGMVMSQTAGAGKLTTENWNQLSDAIPGASGKIQQALLDAGAYTGNFRDAMADGQVTAEEFNAAVMQLGNEPVAVEAAKSTETFEGMIGNLQATLTGGLANAFKELKPYIGSAFNALNDVATVALPILVQGTKDTIDGVKTAIEYGKSFTAWLSEHKVAVSVTAIAIGSLTAGMVAYNIQQKLIAAGGVVGVFQKLATAIKGTTVAQIALNTAMWTNPLTWIVASVVAAGVALWAFFTKTEKGRELWDKLTQSLANGWQWVKDTFSSGVESFKGIWESLKSSWESLKVSFAETWNTISSAFSTVWNGIVTVARWAVGILMAAVFIPIHTYWTVVSSVFKFGWENLIKPAWDAMAVAAQWLWNFVLVPAFNGIKAGFEVVGQAISNIWVSYIKPAWDAIASAATWLWESVLVPAFEVIKNSFIALGENILFVWENAIKVAWDAISTAAMWLWNEILSPAFEAIKLSFQSVGELFIWVFDSLIKPAWDALSSLVQMVWYNILTPVFDSIKIGFQAVGDIFLWVWENVIKVAWNALGDSISFVVDNVVKPAFERLQSGLDVLKGWFQTAVDGIKSIWDGLKAAAAKPVKFVIEKVINNGVIGGWNKVAGLVGLEPADTIPLGDLGAYASGGVLPGYTPGRDVHRFYSPTGGRIDLSGGEAIMRPEWVRAVGGPAVVNKLNLAARMGTLTSGTSGIPDPDGKSSLTSANRSRAMKQQLKLPKRAFASGGLYTPTPAEERQLAGGVVNRSLWVAAKTAFPGATLNSAKSDRGMDTGYHPLGQAIDLGGPMQQIANWIFETYKDSAQLIWGPGPLLLNSARSGRISPDDQAGIRAAYGAATMAGHYNHVHWASDGPITPEGLMISAEGGSSGGGFNLSAMVKSAWDAIVSKIPGYDGLGEFAKLPAAFAKKAVDSVWEFIKSKIGVFSGNSGISGSAESWREMAIAAMRRNGFNADDPAQVNAMIAQIQTESEGIPDRNQEIVDINGTGASAGQGLLQIIPSTWAAYRDPELPDDRTDPWANMNGALRYYKARYGTDLTTMWGQGHGYALGGIVDFLNRVRVHDTGGVLGSGQVALNLSGTDEVIINGPQLQAINRLANNVGVLANRVGEALLSRDVNGARTITTDAIRDAFPNVGAIIDKGTWQDWYEIAGNLKFLDPIMKYTDGMVSAYEKMDKAHASQADSMAKVAEKTKALEDARKKLAEAESTSVDMSVQDQRKLAEAEEKLSKARSESGSSNAEKVADAEEKLKRVREDIASRAEDNEKNRADAIEKAQEAVSKAELDLSDARSAASSAAIAAGHAEIAMAISAASTIYDVVSSLVRTFYAARTASRKLFAEQMAQARDYAKIVDEQRQQVSQLQQSLVDAHIAQVQAMYSLRTAQHDFVNAQLQGQIDIAEAEENFLSLRNKGIADASTSVDDLATAVDRFRMGALDSLSSTSSEAINVIGLIDAAFANFRETGVFSIDSLLAGVQNVTPELMAEAWKVAQVRFESLASEQQAALTVLEATYNQQVASQNLLKAQRDLNLAAAEFAQLTGVTFGMTQQETVVASKVSELLAKNAELEGKRNDFAQTAKYGIGRLFDWNGDGKIFGVVDNAWTAQRNAFDSAIEANNRMIDELMKSEYAGDLAQNLDSVKPILDQAAALYALGEQDAADSLINGSFLGDAGRAKEIAEVNKEISGINSAITSVSDSMDALQLRIPYESEKIGLQASVDAYTAMAKAQKAKANAALAKSDTVRDSYLNLASFNEAYAKSLFDSGDVSQAKAVNIQVPYGKDALSMTEFNGVIKGINDSQNQLDIRVEALEKDGSGALAQVRAVR